MPSDADELTPGRIIAGKYRVERPLGEGGVGVVVLATHLELHQRVAIKALRPSVARSSHVVERFRREAQLAASIASDHVVRVHDVGSLESGTPYMVMEYLEGENLDSVLARGALSVDEAVGWMLQACTAIAHAHEMGIVHRDLKPGNLFLARRPSGGSILKVVDFGISKVTGGEIGARLPRMTEQGDRFGTPIYMSPEQLLSSSDVDPRSDIWSLGVVLFELLTRDIPFAGDDVTAVISNILGGTPMRLRELRRDAPEWLEAVVLRCLARDPAMRFSSVRELAAALSAHGDVHAPVVRTAPVRKRRTLGVVLTVSLVAIGTASAASLAARAAGRAEEPRAIVAATVPAPRATPPPEEAPQPSAAPAPEPEPPPEPPRPAKAATQRPRPQPRSAAPKPKPAPSHADYIEFGDRR